MNPVAAVCKTADPVVREFLSALGNVLTAEMIHTQTDGCIGCGNCGSACAYFLTEQAPHPYERAEGLRSIIWRYFTPLGVFMLRLGLAKPLTIDELNGLSEKVYSCCTMCSRCSFACPQGVNNGQLTAMAKHCLVAAGIVPPLIESIVRNCQSTNNSYGMTFDQGVGVAISIAKELGTVIPVDKQSTCLLNCSAILMNGGQRDLAYAAQLLEAAGVSYTMSSRLVDSGTEAMTTVGDQTLGRKFVEAAVKEAVRLGCRNLIVGECGCDVSTYFVQHADILESNGVQPVLLDTLLLRVVKEGLLPINQLPVVSTYHDPCWMARKGGFFDETRELLHLVVGKVIETTPNRERQICCGGGAGMLRVFPATQEGNNARRAAGSIKAEQLRIALQAGAEVCTTPCTTCVRNIRDLVSYHGVGMNVCTLMEQVYHAWQNSRKESVVC